MWTEEYRRAGPEARGVPDPELSVAKCFEETVSTSRRAGLSAATGQVLELAY
jgi:hypothetical protein